jgi:pentatricopeptide repeat protein
MHKSLGSSISLPSLSVLPLSLAFLSFSLPPAVPLPGRSSLPPFLCLPQAGVDPGGARPEAASRRAGGVRGQLAAQVRERRRHTGGRGSWRPQQARDAARLQAGAGRPDVGLSAAQVREPAAGWSARASAVQGGPELLARASGASAGSGRWSVDARWPATRRARRRSCGGGLLHEMRERGGIDPDKYTYATVISGWCKTGRIEDAAKMIDEMLAAGEVKPTVVMYNALIGGRRGEGNGRHGPNAGRPWPSRRRRGGYGVTSRKERRQSEGGDRMRRARRSHGAARHGELPSSMRRSGQE